MIAERCIRLPQPTHRKARVALGVNLPSSVVVRATGNAAVLLVPVCLNNRRDRKASDPPHLLDTVETMFPRL